MRQLTYRCDQELYYRRTTWPGERLRMFGLRTRARRSTHDLAGKACFTLFTGIRGGLETAAT